MVYTSYKISSITLIDTENRICLDSDLLVRRACFCIFPRKYEVRLEIYEKHLRAMACLDGIIRAVFPSSGFRFQNKGFWDVASTFLKDQNLRLWYPQCNFSKRFYLQDGTVAISKERLRDQWEQWKDIGYGDRELFVGEADDVLNWM